MPLRSAAIAATLLAAIVAAAPPAAAPPAAAPSAAAPSAADHQSIVALPSRDGTHRAYHEYAYAHAVRVGDMIWVSGVPGIGATQAEQVRFALARIKQAIEAAGGAMDDVVELRSYHTDLKLATFDEVAAVRREFFPGGFTAWTAVGTTALLAPGAGVEISAVAVVGSGRRKVGVPPPLPAD